MNFECVKLIIVVISTFGMIPKSIYDLCNLDQMCGVFVGTSANKAWVKCIYRKFD